MAPEAATDDAQRNREKYDPARILLLKGYRYLMFKYRKNRDMNTLEIGFLGENVRWGNGWCHLKIPMNYG